MRNIVIAYFEKIEHIINEIDCLTFYIKNNSKCNDFNVVAQSTLIIKKAKNEQNLNAYTKSIIFTINNFLNNCRRNDECFIQNESIVLNHDSISEIDFDKIFALKIHRDNAKSKHKNDENEQNEKSLMQNLSLICDEILIAQKQNVVEIANEPIFLKIEKKNIEKEFAKQNIDEQNEKNATSFDEICEKQKSKHENNFFLTKSSHRNMYVNEIQLFAHNHQKHLHYLKN